MMIVTNILFIDRLGLPRVACGAALARRRTELLFAEEIAVYWHF